MCRGQLNLICLVPYPLKTTTDDKYFFFQSSEMIGSISATSSGPAGGDRALISRTAPGNQAYRDERWFSNKSFRDGSYKHLNNA